MYLQSRDKYQKFVINKSGSVGLRFEGNKNYENLPIKNFQDDYMTNTTKLYHKKYNRKNE